MPLLYLFDMDDVLYDYDWRARMAGLTALTGLDLHELRRRWWNDEGEWAAEAGRYADAASYHAAFVASIGVPVSVDDWVANRRRNEPMRYAQDFTSCVQETLDARDTEALVEYRERAPSAERSHPTEEHFLPLHVAWGAAGEHPRAERIVSGFEAGALALDSWMFH